MSATPTTPKIMLIRHAEKPGEPPPPHGVTPEGDHDPESLIVQGWQRAGALVPFFAPAAGPPQSPLIATPRYLVASGTTGSKSLRPEQTVTPLGERLGVAIDTTYQKGHPAKLKDYVVGLDGPVLVAWQHEEIPAIANAILGDDTTAPQTWPGDRYDVVWVLDLDRSAGTYGFQQAPQQLLAGDSDSIIEPDIDPQHS